MKRSTSVAMSSLAVEALGGEPGAAQAGARLVTAMRFYLADRGSGEGAWPFPSFLRGSEVREDVELPLTLDEELWGAFEAEAAAQGVSPQQLAEHAAFYLAAEIDAGRATQRILDDLGDASAGED